jgi:hypothetical protein
MVTPPVGRLWLRAVQMALATVVVAVLVVSLPVGSNASSGASASEAPVLGILGSGFGELAQERAAGVGAITVSAGWNQAEPRRGTFSTSYLGHLRMRVAQVRAAGLRVILDPGLQYAPAWVFTLPGGTRFVDQYGDVFTGRPASGNEVANAVTDPAVRAAESTYLAWLGSHFALGSFMAVRQGGGPLGELRYPSATFNAHTNSFWAYDSSTQAQLPPSVRGWAPGTGTTTQAATFLDAYNSAIDAFGVWLNGQMERDFATDELVMLPGWGERPGVASSEVASRLTLHLPEFNEGLDWSDLLPALPDPTHSVAYTTYLDAVSFQPTLQEEDPADFIVSLVSGTQLRLGGENTGNGTWADMYRTVHRAADHHYVVVQWMNEAQLNFPASPGDPNRPTLQRLGALATALLNPAA